jgi:branched-chain amino acid transport system permease protein
MDLLLIATQRLNGIQFGIMLFLMAAGLTLVSGVMNLINLTHGSLYLMGAYLAATLQQKTGAFLLTVALAVPITIGIGMLVEVIALRKLYRRDQLDQVVATYGLILFFNERVRIIWGPQAYFMTLPALPAYDHSSRTLGSPVPLLWLINRTRLGMLIRAGASNRQMVNALGVNIRLLYTALFGLGAALAGLAGMMAGPIPSIEVVMGEPILILALVVIVIGGIGSVRGAFLAAILLGIVDNVGRVLLPAALASMVIYLIMAAVLCRRLQGLFPGNGRTKGILIVRRLFQWRSWWR